ncbi:hypothetical protein AVEN_251748-1, partial [Araneus ventricosus]
ENKCGVVYTERSAGGNLLLLTGAKSRLLPGVLQGHSEPSQWRRNGAKWGPHAQTPVLRDAVETKR